METQEVLTAPAGESPGTEIPAPETPPPSQEGEKPQEPAIPKVEGTEQPPQVTVPQRVKASDAYRERDKIRKLEESLIAERKWREEMTPILEKLKQNPAGPEADKFDMTKWYEDPASILQARDQALMKMIEDRFNQLTAKEQQAEQVRSYQEALELLLPKSGTDEESFEERVAKNPERAEKIDKMLKGSFGKFWEVDPRGAAELMLMKLDTANKQPASPTVIKKSLMGGSARGNPGMGGPKQTPFQEKMAELKRLEAEASTDVSLRFDEKHKARREQVREEIAKLAKE